MGRTARGGDRMESIIAAALALVGTLAGSYFANRRSSVLIAYRLEALEKKVEAHNNLVERMYQVEERTELQEEKLKVVNHRLQDLERSA